jgi:hypothetical protein
MMSGAAGAGGAAAARTNANVNVNPLGGWETQEGDPEVLVRAIGVEAVEDRAADGDRQGGGEGVRLMVSQRVCV